MHVFAAPFSPVQAMLWGSATQFVEEVHRLGVHVLPSGPNAVRAVCYLDITDSDVERASELVGQALRNLERQPKEAVPAATKR